LLIEAGLYRKDLTPDDGSRFDDHFIVGWDYDSGRQGRLGATQEANQKQKGFEPNRFTNAFHTFLRRKVCGVLSFQGAWLR
jgi:hypothetical protein